MRLCVHYRNASGMILGQSNLAYKDFVCVCKDSVVGFSRCVCFRGNRVPISFIF